MKIVTSIFKTFFLSLMMVAQVHFAFAQAPGSILPPAKTTFNDQNGKPLTGGSVQFYIPSTTTPKTTWQDQAETIPNSNPVILDAAGRALIWGSGNYRQIVKDRNNNLIWDQVTSAAGSGSSGPTATGDGDLVGTIKPWAGMTAPNQYLFTYGQQISRVTYAALFTAITSSQAVFCSSGSPILTGLSDTTNFPIGANVEVTCLASGQSTIISKTSTTITLAANANVTTNTTAIIFPWGNGNGTTTFNLPDFRGFAIAGNNNMGGVASSVLTTTYFGSTNPNSIGAAGGNQSVTLLTANLPTFTPAGTVATTVINGAITPSTSNLLNPAAGGNLLAGGGSIGSAITLSLSQAISTATSTFSGTPIGSSIPFSTVQPTKTSNYIIKVTPDANSATASGVTDINGMTGSIGCTGSIICTGNNISLTSLTNIILFGVTTMGSGTPVSTGVQIGATTTYNTYLAGGYHPFVDNNVYNIPNAAGAAASFSCADSITGSTNNDHYTCLQDGAFYNNSGVISTIYGGISEPSMGSSTGTIGIRYGWDVWDVVLGGGTLNEQIGLHTKSLVNAVTNYAIMTEGITPSYFLNGCLGYGGQTITFTNSSSTIGGAVVPPVGCVVNFSTTGGLPSGFSISKNYYVVASTPSTSFKVSATPGGSAITAGSAGSGTQTLGYTYGIQLHAATGATGSAYNTISWNGVFDFQSTIAPMIGITATGDGNDGTMYFSTAAAAHFLFNGVDSYNFQQGNLSPTHATASNNPSIGTAANAWSVSYFNTHVSTGSAPIGNTGACVATSFIGGNTTGTFVTATGCSSNSVILSGLQAAPTGYVCTAADQTTPADKLNQTASSTTSVTFTGSTANNDVIAFSCEGF